MAARTFRWERYIHDFEGMLPAERAVLDQEGITKKDFLDAYQSRAHWAEEVGPYAARVWFSHRNVAGASPGTKRKFSDIMQNSHAPVIGREWPVKAKAKLHPGSSSGLRLVDNKIKHKQIPDEVSLSDELNKQR